MRGSIICTADMAAYMLRTTTQGPCHVSEMRYTMRGSSEQGRAHALEGV